jgi:putative PIN family toxin of toxin-antitoxin system
LVLDTNILVSYCISQLGYSFLIIDKVVLAGKAEWIITKEILDEYSEVLSRARFIRKFPRFEHLARHLMDEIQIEGKWVFPNEKIDLLTDKTDNKFLEAAIAANSDYLITGNSLDFRIQEFRNTQIVSPQQYWNHFKRNI